MTKRELYTFLDLKGIHYQISEHKPVYNMTEVAEIALPYPEANAKNLFIRDHRKKVYYLITIRGDKRIDLKEFKKTQGTRQLEFATSEELQNMLDLTPGSVTPFGLLNDKEHKISWFLDRSFENELIGCHPNENTSTVWINSSDLVALIQEHGNTVHLIDL